MDTGGSGRAQGWAVRRAPERWPHARKEPEFVDLQLVRVSDTEAIFLVFFTTREALDDLSSPRRSALVRRALRPYLAGPVQRSVGEVAYHAAAQGGR